MKINDSQFVISAFGPAQYPDDGLPEIALAGRSNVGKSSLINCLIQRKNLARRSATPGKTQSLNYYRIIGTRESESVSDDGERFEHYFVDLPGYGYAKVSKAMRQQWGTMIEHYLQHRDELKLVVLVVDLRHAPTGDDLAMYEWLQHYRIPCCVVATKADKIPRGRWDKHLALVRKTLDMPIAEPLIIFSAENGLGREPLWHVIHQVI